MELVPAVLACLPELSRLRWTLRLEKPLVAPRYLGSALRGLLGHGLRRTACVTRRAACGGCPLASRCVYTALFEPASCTPPQARVPYVLAVPVTEGRHYAAGDMLSFEMTLAAPHQQHLPYLVHALRLAGRRGLGPARAGFTLAGVEGLATLGKRDWLPLYDEEGLGQAPPVVSFAVPPMPQGVRLQWLTPFRFKRHGRLVRPEQFDVPLLFESLLYRLYNLAGERPPRERLEQARAVRAPLTAKLDWQDWSRYSSRQKARMQIGGLMGILDMRLDKGFTSWWPLLWVGQWLHVGKLTSMGLGRYTLDAASLPEHRCGEGARTMRHDGTAQDRATERAGMSPS